MKAKTIFRNSIGICIVCLLTMTNIGCRKFVEVPAPKNQLVNSNVFNDDKTANAVVAGMYASMYNFTNPSVFSGRYTTIFPGLSADELTSVNASTTTFVQFQTNTLQANDYLIANYWQGLYAVIYQANMVIEGLQKPNSVSAAMKNQLLGEAYFTRAFCNVYLVNYFGAVPLITTTDPSQTALQARAPASDVYKAVVSDLQQAQAKLANDYSYSSGEKVRANKWVATALLARVYLYLSDWKDAGAQASAVIQQSSLYSLSDINSVFLKNSSEAILQFFIANYTYLGNQFIPTGTNPPTFALTDQLISSFEPGDQRKTNWTNSVATDGNTYYYPYKYKGNSANMNNNEYDMVIRLAEMYLISAESKAQLDDISGSQADLNAIRTRAGLPNTSATDKASLLTAILHERQTELFCEWGHRWLDLKRTGSADAVLSAEKTNWKSSGQLYPIPQTEIGRNPNLTQNPGY
ncbi:MAG: RagB/SusD family nutrient uptake outer membrane protein [Flavipsychrobacter sp.]